MSLCCRNLSRVEIRSICAAPERGGQETRVSKRRILHAHKVFTSDGVASRLANLSPIDAFRAATSAAIAFPDVGITALTPDPGEDADEINAAGNALVAM